MFGLQPPRHISTLPGPVVWTGTKPTICTTRTRAGFINGMKWAGRWRSLEIMLVSRAGSKCHNTILMAQLGFTTYDETARKSERTKIRHRRPWAPIRRRRAALWGTRVN